MGNMHINLLIAWLHHFTQLYLIIHCKHLHHWIVLNTGFKRVPVGLQILNVDVVRKLVSKLSPFLIKGLTDTQVKVKLLGSIAFNSWYNIFFYWPIAKANPYEQVLGIDGVSLRCSTRTHSSCCQSYKQALG